MKKKIILTIAFLISLLPMLLNQYGGMKGVQEISGLINLLNSIGIISMLVFLQEYGHHLKMSIQNSIEFAFSEFYVGLLISLIMIFVYLCIDKIVKE